jgi:hypothetical protein
MKTTIRCLSAVPALAVLIAPAIAKADLPPLTWSPPPFVLFDTDSLGAQPAFNLVNSIPGLNLHARAESDLTADGGVANWGTWFEAVGTARLSASAGSFSLNSAPDVDVYAEYLQGTNTYRAYISVTDFSGNMTYLAGSPDPVGNPLSYNNTIFTAPTIPKQQWSAAGLEIDLTTTAYLGGNAAVSVDPLHGIQSSVVVTPSLQLTALGYAPLYTYGTAMVSLYDNNSYTACANGECRTPQGALGPFANAAFAAAVTPTTNPSTNNAGFCFNAGGIWGLQGAMQASYSAVSPAAGTGGTFPGVGPGPNQSIGSVSKCWGPLDGTWTGSYYGTGLISDLFGGAPPSCTIYPGCGTTTPSSVWCNGAMAGQPLDVYGEVDSGGYQKLQSHFSGGTLTGRAGGSSQTYYACVSGTGNCSQPLSTAIAACDPPPPPPHCFTGLHYCPGMGCTRLMCQ